MANSTYDLDLSGGLMPQIQALLAPPSMEDVMREKRKDGLALHPYYKRPGRGHNRDSCDACKEGGELICCDSCPASFHLQCHDPPLEETDLPKGLWNCHSCRVQKAQASTSNPRVQINDEEICEDSGCSGGSQTSTGQGLPETIMKRRGTSNSDDVDVVNPEGSCDKNSEKGESTDCIEKVSVFGPLIKAAASMNPQQFELPPELIEPIGFPGSSKTSLSKKGGAAPKKKTFELDNGLVPLPLRACFYCNKSCRKAPMVACDFCPLVFHLDCLDPPLVCMPVGKWMCPNHPQNIEYKLLKDSRLTERVKFWSYMQKPLDHETVKIDFLRKVNRKNPPFRRKEILRGRPRMRVPQIIKDQYKHPPLLPAKLNFSQPFFWSSILPESRKSINNLQDSCEAIEQTESQIQDQTSLRASDCLPTPTNDIEEVESKMKDGGIAKEESKSNEDPFLEELQGIESEVKDYLATLRRSMKERHLKIFMEQLSSDLLSSMDQDTLRMLAMQRVQELILNPESRALTIYPNPGMMSSSSSNTNATVTTQPWMQQCYKSDSENSSPGIFPRQPRAFLCPLSSTYPPAPIYHRRFTIGTGADMDLTLTSFGSCNYVSGHHSTIFYDEMSRHFELLNYSEHGTIVDNVVYCCDIGDELSKPETVEDSKEKRHSFIGSEDLFRHTVEKIPGPPCEPKEVHRCGCRTEICSIGSAGAQGTKGGWEGTALLTHGSHVKFGCLQFILCISNTNEKPRFIHH